MQQKPSRKPNADPRHPRQEIAVIVFSFNSCDHLLICDTFSKYPFLIEVPRKTTEIQSKNPADHHPVQTTKIPIH